MQRDRFHLPADGLLSLSLDETLLGRSFHTPQHPGDVFSSSTPLHVARLEGIMPPLGAWWTTREAADASSRLDTAAATLPTPLRGRAIDMLSYPAHDLPPGAQPMRRRVAFTDTSSQGDALPEAVASLDATVADEWRELDNSSEPTAILLQHHFLLEGGSKLLTLRTLIFGDYNLTAPPAAFAQSAFGGEPVALQAANSVATPATSVFVDGECLSAAALAVLPKTQRDEVKAARVAQLVSALRGCLKHNWPGGFGMLRRRVEPLLPPATCVALENCAAMLVLLRAGGMETHQLFSIRTAQAEYLEAQGKYRQAAALYKKNIEGQNKLNMLDDPSDAYANLGCALYNSDIPADLEASEAAFENALLALTATVPASRKENPWWRRRSEAERAAHVESMRLRFLQQIICAQCKRNPTSPAAAGLTVMRMFEPYVTQADQGGSDQIECNISGNGEPSVRFLATGLRLMLRTEVDPVSRQAMWRVVRVEAGAPMPRAANEAYEAKVREWIKHGVAKSIVAANRSAHKLPPLPAQCAWCGEMAADPSAMMKLCGGCRAVSYCGPECAKAHWPAHKGECRKATAAAAAAAAESAAADNPAAA